MARGQVGQKKKGAPRRSSGAPFSVRLRRGRECPQCRRRTSILALAPGTQPTDRQAGQPQRQQRVTPRVGQLIQNSGLRRTTVATDAMPTRTQCDIARLPKLFPGLALVYAKPVPVGIAGAIAGAAMVNAGSGSMANVRNRDAIGAISRVRAILLLARRHGPRQSRKCRSGISRRRARRWHGHGSPRRRDDRAYQPRPKR